LHKGTIIAISWPYTLVVKEGKWYDTPMTYFGFIKDNYYKVGHAAMLLIDSETGHISYMDFGRYHTPMKMGRVRSEITDPDLIFSTKALFDDYGSITNMESILLEVDAMPTSHGDGKTLASVLTDIDYKKAYNKALAIQNKGAVDYGPFVLKGTNCSRFVAQVSRTATNNWLIKALLAIPYTVTPSPRSNIRVIKNTMGYFEIENGNISLKPAYLTTKIFRRKLPAFNFARKN